MADRCNREKGRDVVQYENVEEKLEREFHEARRRGDLIELGDHGLIYVDQWAVLEDICSTKDYGGVQFHPKCLLSKNPIRFGHVSTIESPIPFSTSDFEQLKHLPYLESLTVNFFRGNEDYRGLQDLTSLKKLNFNGCNLFDSDIFYLKDLTSLEFIDLSHNSNLTNVSLEYLAGLPNLKELKMFWTRVGGEEAVEFRNRMSHINRFVYGCM